MFYRFLHHVSFLRSASKPGQRLGLLLAVLLLAAACSANSDLTLDGGTPTNPTADTEVPTPEPAEDPTPVVEPTPEPTAEPTATPEPEVDVAGLLSAGQDELDAIDISSVVIELDQATAGLRLDTFTIGIADLENDLGRVELKLTGSGWRDLLDEDTPGVDPESTILYVLDGETGYYSSSPLTENLDPDRPWVIIQDDQLIGPDNVVVELDPRNAVGAFGQLIDNIGTPTYVGEEAINLFDGEGDQQAQHITGFIEGSQLLNLLPARQLVAINDTGLEDGDLQNAVPVDLWFGEDGTPFKASVNFRDMYEEAGALSGNSDLGDTDLQITWTLLNVNGGLEVTVPSEDEVAGDIGGPQCPGTETNTGENDGPGVRPLVLSVGECYTEEELELLSAVDIACDQPHIAEVYFVTQFLDPVADDFPGVESLVERGSEVCNQSLVDIVGVRGEISVFRIQLFRPSEESWEVGDRELACFVRYPEPIVDLLANLDPIRVFGLVSPFHVEVGDCIVEDDLSVGTFTLAQCTEPHFFEVFISDVLPEGPYPGDDDMNDLVDELCLESFEDFVGIEYAASVWFLDSLQPNENTWTNFADRRVSCLLTLEIEASRSAQDDAE